MEARLKYLSLEGFVPAIRKRQYFYMPGLIPEDKLYTWSQIIHACDSHPVARREVSDKKLRITLLDLHDRSPKRYCLDMLDDLRKMFNKNAITLHAFVSFTDHAESYGFHKDEMDVLYVQDQGTAIMQLEDDLEYTMSPGDALWIPRGRHHYPQPMVSRMGCSFGVEGKPNPCDFI